MNENSAPGSQPVPAKQMLDKLTEEEVKKVMSVGIRKLMLVSISIYNNLCFECHAKVVRNPRLHVNLYCDKCRPMAIEKMRRLIK